MLGVERSDMARYMAQGVLYLKGTVAFNNPLLQPLFNEKIKELQEMLQKYE